MPPLCDVEAIPYADAQPHRAWSRASSEAPAASPAAPSSVLSGGNGSGSDVESGSVLSALSVPDSSERPDYAEFFMPPRDLEAARHLAVV
jgi:hypothetical protein